MDRRKLLLLAAIAALVVLFFAFDLGRFLDLDFLQAQRGRLHGAFLARPWAVGAGFFVVYVAVTGLSLPGAAVLTLVAGAVFGLLWGTVIVSFASTAGATLAFLLARYIARDAVRRRFDSALGRIDEGVRKDGPFYLFTLRLVPVFPFFIINLAMGLTSMRVAVFALVSQVGMLPGTVVFVNAGTQLGEIEGIAGVLSPELWLSFVLLGIFPIAAKMIVDALRARRIYRGFSRPKRFDRDLVVIGAGSAGLVSSLVGATVRARVTLVEKDEMGGDCLNTGCVPSKSLIRSAKFLSHVARAREFGIREADAQFDFAEVMARVRRNIERIAPHDSVERYEGSRCRVRAGRGAHRVALRGASRRPDHHHPKHRHRDRGGPVRAADSGHRGLGGPDLRDGVGPGSPSRPARRRGRGGRSGASSRSALRASGPGCPRFRPTTGCCLARIPSSPRSSPPGFAPTEWRC